MELKAYLLFFPFFSISYVNLIVGEVPVMTSVIVDQNGRGNFTSIGAAIAYVPANNNQWFRIHVNAGVYREKLNITEDKGFILLEGEGYDQTSVEWGDYAHVNSSYDLTMQIGTRDTATFTLSGNNIVVKSISFKNTYDGGPALGQAVAALIEGDKVSFYNCNFYGIQDTLCDFRGRHYYRECSIQGAVDFIWGSAQTIYENCGIFSFGQYVDEGFITAHGRDDESETSGFVFKSCIVFGSLKTYLGRAWKPFSRVVFYDTLMADIIDPLGWDAWNAKGGQENSTFYTEVDCAGPGSNKSGRVSWEKTINEDQVRQFISMSFIDDEGWIGLQP